jgi:hypothetical protein
VSPVTSAPSALGAAPTGVKRLLTRTLVRLRSGRLDAALADGADPWGSPELLLRASELVSLQERRRIATALDSSAAIAGMGRAASAQVRLRYRVLRSYRDDLVSIAVRLRDPRPVEVGVVARMAVLLWDGSSPLFVGGRPVEELAETVEHCLDSLRLPH